MNEYVVYGKSDKILRLPLDGSIDLTYCCNNNCRHCWLKTPQGSLPNQEVLTIEEIKAIVDDARKMGCQRWSISGGEPMIRPDFAEIFDYITSRSISYSLNTNGTLITTDIAKLMKRNGNKMVALYGATPEVHDHITRNPGSFKATMKGISYLKEARAGFTVQLIPMKDNYHQYHDMCSLAESLSSHRRVGAVWLYLSACDSPQKNAEIVAQRLPPAEIIALDDFAMHCLQPVESEKSNLTNSLDNRLFASCAQNRQAFHIDPYGQMTFCCFIKDPKLRYDLRKGSFQEAWEEFIPSLADKVQGGKEYIENCGPCNLRAYCNWCPVFAYLEHGRYGAKIDYLCKVAGEKLAFSKEWTPNHRRFYRIGGITIQVESDLPIHDNTFSSKFNKFQVDKADVEMIFIRHHFKLPNLNGQDLGEEVYHKLPWIIYRKGHSWIYLGVYPDPVELSLQRVVFFNDDHTSAEIYNSSPNIFLKGRLDTITLFPNDQILLAKVLADRNACFLHSAGMILDGKGLLFVGHSEAGKSTTVKMLKGKGEILCDDRNIVRLWPEGFRVHGSWSHGEIPQISSASAPLNAILFLKKSEKNRLTPLDDRGAIIKTLMACLVKPFVTADWWNKNISLLEKIARDIPCYQMEFDKSGDIVLDLQRLLQTLQA
jgi:radical SAM protein with 4Fe4S-binding SPASM domain